jgi:ketosteroid isomerase-like protein
MRMGISEVELETLEFEQHGETGWESGQATLMGKDGTTIDTVQYVVIWKQEDGRWKWHRDIWNSLTTLEQR